MRGRPPSILLLAVLVGACGGDRELPAPPAGYATYARDGVEFRHPPGWEAERAVPNGPSRVTVRLRPPNANPDRPGPLITLRISTLTDSFEAFRDRSQVLAGAGAAEPEELEVEVPGADESAGRALASRDYDSVLVAARVGENVGVQLDAGAPEGDTTFQPGAVAGSLRIRGLRP